MGLSHPLAFLAPRHLKPAFWFSLALTLACLAVFQGLDQPLRTLAAPSGIVSFEVAGSVQKTQAMLDSWDARGRLLNAFGLGFDFLFMPVYTTTLALGVLLASNRRSGPWPRLAAALGWAAYLGMAFDAIENTCLLTILLDSARSPFPEIAASCAWIKFTLIILPLGYALAGGLLPERK
jgi:hypothetical protein